MDISLSVSFLSLTISFVYYLSLFIFLSVSLVFFLSVCLSLVIFQSFSLSISFYLNHFNFVSPLQSSSISLSLSISLALFLQLYLSVFFSLFLPLSTLLSLSLQCVEGGSQKKVCIIFRDNHFPYFYVDSNPRNRPASVFYIFQTI